MDEKLLLILNHNWTHPALDRVMAAASSLDLWMPLLVLGVILLAWKGGFRERAFLVCTLLTICVMDGIVSNGLKHLVDRPRPFQARTGVRIVTLAPAIPRLLALGLPVRVKASRAAQGDVDGRSFPSGHTINTFSVATLSALFFRRGWLVYLAAGLVGYSRVYTGSHWPTDVLISAMLATGCTLMLAVLFEKLWDLIGPRRFPGLHSAHPNLRMETP